MFYDTSDTDEKRGFVSETDKKECPHDGKPITMIEMSPNGKYIVTYSEIDDTVVGWNVDDKEGSLEPIKADENDSHIIHIEHKESKIVHMCVSDKKILAYSNVEYGSRVSTSDLKSNGIHDHLKLYFKYFLDKFYCSFNAREQFILFGVDGDIQEHNIVWVYLTRGNRWMCQKIYTVPAITEIISISKFDKIWLRSDDHIHEWNIMNKETMVISRISRGIKTKDIRISDYKKYTCLKIKNNIIVYSSLMGIPIPIASVDLNDELRLFKFMKNTPELHCLLLTLIDQNSNNKILDYITKYCRNICLDQFKKHNRPSTEYEAEDLPNLPCLFYNCQSNNYMILVVGGYVWKIQIDKIDFDLSLEIKADYDDQFTESWMTYFDRDDSENYENPFILDMNIDKDILFLQIPKSYKDEDIRLDIFILNEIIGLRVFNVKNEQICELFKKTKYEIKVEIEEVKIFKTKEIVISTNFGVFIFHLNEKNELILDYFQYIHHQLRQQVNLNWLSKFMFISNKYLEDDRKLPIDGWVAYVKNDRENFLKHGTALLMFAIEVHDLKLINDIYKKCLNYFKQDLERNKAFLTIINSSMPFLKMCYPEYLSRTQLLIASTFLGFIHLTVEIRQFIYSPIKWFQDYRNLLGILKILKEIEMFYMLPHQRRWKSWFPDTIYYYANVDTSRRKVNELIKNDEWRPEEFPEMKRNLLKILDVQDN
ncbi:9189_t:CDS:2 [Funneliformis mosseae]|uniref:9189_t:CDS:1 n=1 Tax=Funneliformis mosseae TaxID=27381 RepID=A0A9N9FBP1_FUNMO|nr:9189_t:CDS:2 [Funneliformis mosseae]